MKIFETHYLDEILTLVQCAIVARILVAGLKVLDVAFDSLPKAPPLVLSHE